MQEQETPFDTNEVQKYKRTSESYLNRDPNGYKIKCGNWYPLYRTEYAGNVFFKIMVSKKTINGDRLPLYKLVSFYKDGEKYNNIKNGVLVKPLRFQEDGYYLKNDRYNIIWNLKLYEWEVKENDEQEFQDAVQDYKNSINVEDLDFNDDLPF